MTAIKRPVLRYHGGKWRLAPWIIAHFPTHRTYTESYGGAGSVLLRKPRAYAEVYNDLDGEVVNLFRVLRTQGDELRRALELTPYARDEFDLSYEPADDAVEQARRTMVRSFLGFGSAAASGAQTGFRCNSNRSHTTPAQDWRNLPASIPATVERLRGVVIENRPAIAVLTAHDSPSTLHYVDPPYPLNTRGMRNIWCRKGYRFEMTDDQHRDLAAALHTVQGMVVLSGYPCDLYDQELFRDWYRAERDAHADGARDRTEVLWLNPSATRALGCDRGGQFPLALG